MLRCKNFLFIILLFIGCASEYMAAGKIYFGQKNYEKAIEQFKKQLEQNPRDADGMWWLAQSYYQLREFNNCCEYLDKMKETAPDKKELNTEKLFIWSAYFNAGIEARKKENMNLALHRFIQATEILPESLAPYPNIADIYYTLDKEDTASIWYKKMIDIDSTNPFAIKNLAVYYTRKKDYDSAIKYFNKLLSVSPDDADAWYRFGVVYYRKGEYDSSAYELAKKCFNETIKYDSTFSDAYYNLAAIFMREKNFEKAAECLKSVVEINPDDVDALLHLGNVYLQLEKYDEAIKIYTNVIEKDSTKYEAYEGRASAYWHIGEKEKSNADLLKSKELKK